MVVPGSNLQWGDKIASLYNGTIAWRGCFGSNGCEIFFWDGNSTIQVTDPPLSGVGGYYPQMSNNLIAWHAREGGSDLEIFYAVIRNMIEVNIDIKPGSYPNSINLQDKGVVPVAILTTADFDASTVYPTTVKIANASPIRWKMQDVNGDSDRDLLVYFNTFDLNLDNSSTTATLTGQTIDGINIEGNDSVQIVTKGKK